MTTAVTHRIPTLLDAYQPISDALEVAGIRVTADFTNVHPPCVYIHPPEMEFRFHKGDFTARYRVTVMVGLTDRLKAIGQLSEFMAQVLEALSYRVQTAVPVDVITADQTTAIPAMELSWTARVGRGLQ
jgi:hypothetical protein